MMTRTFVLLIVFVVAAGCNAAESTKLDPVFGNAQAVSTVKNAKKVQAFRLPPTSTEQALLSEYRKGSEPVEVPADTVAKLRTILLDPATYDFDRAKACDPVYGVRIQFAQDKETVDVLFCFECDILTVYHNGKRVGGEDFDKSRPRLVAIVKALFPQDKEIQALK